MSYRRSTRAVTLGEVPPVLRDAIADHATKHQLSLDSVRAWLTHSENPPATGLFGKLFGKRANSVDPDAEHDSLLVLHRTHVVIATTGAKRGTAVLSLPLLQASVVRGSGVAARLAMKVPGADDGMTISGFPGDEGRPGTYFFGLGTEPAAADCFVALETAIMGVKR